MSRDQKPTAKCAVELKRRRLYGGLQSNVRLIIHLQRTDLRHMLIKHMQKHCLMHRLSLTSSWVGALSKFLWIVQVSDILYLSLSISAERLLPVNKVEIVKGSTQLRDDIRSFCQITHTITSIYSVTESITCKNQVIMDLLLWSHLEFKSKLPTLLPMEAFLALTSRWGRAAILACLFSQW